MARAPFLPSRYRFLLSAFGLYLLVLTSLRVVFWLVFRGTDEPAPAGTIPRAFFIGFKLDVRLVLFLMLPVVAFWRLPPLDPAKKPEAVRLWAGHLAFVICLVVFFYVLDFANYDWLNERIDASRLNDAGNFEISWRVAWESYPVGWTLLGLLGLGAGFYFVLAKLMRRWVTDPVQVGKRRQRVVAWVTVALVLFGLYGKVSWYPLRWSDAYFTTHRFSSHTALNPVLFFFDTLCVAEEQAYDPEMVAAHYDHMARYLGVEQPDPETLSFVRRVRPLPAGGKKPNIVLIQLEGFSAHYTGVFGNPLEPSPHFDALARDGLLFRNFYAHRDGTARCVFALLTGIPDTITYKTASRNPRIVSQHTILNALEGYEKYYFLGGSASWANIRGLLTKNVEGLRIYEEGSFDSPRGDVWGISDLHLFEEANKVLRKSAQPFVVYIQSSSNHRPYTIPEDNRGFEKKVLDEDRLEKYGFKSVDHFNSFRFLDHSLGFFLELAKKEDYFENTLFVMFGDNGQATKSAHMPAYEALGLNIAHIPLLIYGPGLISQARMDDTPGGQADVLPTIAALAGTAALNTTLGSSLVTGADRPRYAFMQTKAGADPEIGLVGKDHLLLIKTNGRDARLYSLRSKTPRADVASQHPDLVREMSEVALGYFHLSKYIMYHNAPSRYGKE